MSVDPTSRTGTTSDVFRIYGGVVAFAFAALTGVSFFALQILLDMQDDIQETKIQLRDLVAITKRVDKIDAWIDTFNSDLIQNPRFSARDAAELEKRIREQINKSQMQYQDK